MRPYAGFVAKNATPEEVPRAFSFPGIAHLFADKEPDRLLCTVRALALYCNRSAVLPSADIPGRLLNISPPVLSFGSPTFSVGLWRRLLLRMNIRRKRH